MVRRRFWAQGIVTLLLLTGLLACGGGGGSSTPPPPPPSGTAFWAADFNTNSYYKVYASVVATGTRCYIYVENGLTVSAAMRNAVMNEFDINIYPTITGKFGSEPNPGVDGDSRIYILLLNIRDGFNPVSSPSYVAGYFMSDNEYPLSANPNSNEKEMFYMNVNPALTISPTGFYTTLAHEFQHMINWEQKVHIQGWPEEDTWLNEAMSEIAPTYLYGPNYARVYDYEQAPSDSLTIWKNSINDYGIAYMWSQYFKDQFDSGGNAFKTIMQQNSVGITSVTSALTNSLAPGTGKTFANTFNDMAIAIFSGNTISWGGGNEKWAYTSIDTKAGTYNYGITNAETATLPGLTTTLNLNLTSLPNLDPWSVGYSWYQPLSSGPTGTVTWTGSTGATAAFIDYGTLSLNPVIASGTPYPYTTTGILIVSTPSSAATATGSVVNASLSAGSPAVSMTPKQMLSKANTYAAKHHKNQEICVQSFFAEKEKELRAKGIRPNF